LDKIVESTDIDGLTVSGGEPMLQKEALSSLLHKVREMRPDLSVILFTGYLLEDFQSDVSKDVLDCIDLLIDGEYYHEQNDDMGLRGSANQRLHFLTSRLTSHKEELETGKRKYDMHLHGDNEIWTIGIAPSRGGFNG
jgi:anaerobic ribonucleoside-triphosphate reductase activating protein